MPSPSAIVLAFGLRLRARRRRRGGRGQLEEVGGVAHPSEMDCVPCALWRQRGLLQLEEGQLGGRHPLPPSLTNSNPFLIPFGGLRAAAMGRRWCSLTHHAATSSRDHVRDISGRRLGGRAGESD